MFTYAVVSLLIVLATIALTLLLRRRSGSAVSSGPQALIVLIVLSSQGFPVGSAAATVTAFRAAGLQVVMSTREAGMFSIQL